MNRLVSLTPIRPTPWARSARPLVATIITFTLAYGLDRWIEITRWMAAETFHFWPVTWTMLAANVLLAGALLGVAWELHRPQPFAQVVRTVCLLVGLALALLPMLFTSDLAVGVPTTLASLTSPTSRVGTASAFLVVISSSALVRFRHGDS